MCTFGLSGCRVKPRRPSGPTLRAPTLRCPTLRAPTLRTPTLGALTFSRSGPHSSGPPTFGPPFLRAPPFGPPSLRAEALQASTFSVSGPLRSSFLSCCSFVLFLCIFNCFFFLGWKFQCFSLFFTKKCFFSKKKKFHFSSWGGGVEVSKPKTQTSFQFGGGGYYPSQTQTPSPCDREVLPMILLQLLEKKSNISNPIGRTGTRVS